MSCTKCYINKAGDKKFYTYDSSKYTKKHYEKNKDKYCEKVNCECGGKYMKINKSHHFKTKKHQNYLSSLN